MASHKYRYKNLIDFKTHGCLCKRPPDYNIQKRLYDKITGEK